MSVWWRFKEKEKEEIGREEEGREEGRKNGDFRVEGHMKRRERNRDLEEVQLYLLTLN